MDDDARIGLFAGAAGLLGIGVGFWIGRAASKPAALPAAPAGTPPNPNAAQPSGSASLSQKLGPASSWPATGPDVDGKEYWMTYAELGQCTGQWVDRPDLQTGPDTLLVSYTKREQTHNQYVGQNVPGNTLLAMYMWSRLANVANAPFVLVDELTVEYPNPSCL